MARPSSQTTPTQRPSRTHSVAARAPSMTVTPAVSTTTRGELAHDAPAGRAAAGVDDAPARVAALEAEREVAVAVGVEVHAEALEVARRCAGASRHRTVAGARAHEVAPGALGVLAVQVGRVVDRERRRQAALGPVARGARERRRGDERDARAGARRGERGVEARGAGADDDEVGLDARGARPCAGTVTRWPRRSCFTTRRRSSTTPARTPSAPARIVAIERALGARDWLGWDVRESPAAELEVARGRAPGRLRARDRASSCAAGGGALDADTVVSEGS